MVHGGKRRSTRPRSRFGSGYPLSAINYQPPSFSDGTLVKSCARGDSFVRLYSSILCFSFKPMPGHDFHDATLLLNWSQRHLEWI